MLARLAEPPPPLKFRTRSSQERRADDAAVVAQLGLGDEQAFPGGGGGIFLDALHHAPPQARTVRQHATAQDEPRRVEHRHLVGHRQREHERHPLVQLARRGVALLRRLLQRHGGDLLGVASRQRADGRRLPARQPLPPLGPELLPPPSPPPAPPWAAPAPPATPLPPVTSLPLAMTALPTPEPTNTVYMSCEPRPAPALNSPQAAARRSFTTRTPWPSRSASSAPSGTLRQPRLGATASTPDSPRICPAAPTPHPLTSLP